MYSFTIQFTLIDEKKNVEFLESFKQGLFDSI